MLDTLSKYKQNDHFFLNAGASLEKVCNAPADKSGVFIIHALQDGRIELTYVGSSGKREKDGSISVRKAGLGGLKDSIVNDMPFSLSNQIRLEKIEALDIYWFVTHDKKYRHCPQELRQKLLQEHTAIFGRLPRWNNQVQRG